MKCFPVVDIYFLTMTAVDSELEQRSGMVGGGATGFSSSMISSFLNPKLGGGIVCTVLCALNT